MNSWKFLKDRTILSIDSDDGYCNIMLPPIHGTALLSRLVAENWRFNSAGYVQSSAGSLAPIIYNYFIRPTNKRVYFINGDSRNCLLNNLTDDRAILN